MQEKIIYQAKLHPIVFAQSILMSFLGFFMAFRYSLFATPSAIIGGVGLAWFGISWVAYRYSFLTIQQHRMSLCSGLFVRKVVDIPYNKIEIVDVRQGILGGIFGYGSLLVTGTGGSHYVIHAIAHPLTCRRYIEQMMYDQ